MEEAKNNLRSDTHVKESNNNKRKLPVSYNDDLQDSYFKIRLLLRKLRPHFIQVLQTSDFRNCKAAHDIKKDLKLLLDLYKQMIGKTDPPVKNVTELQTEESGLLKTEDCVEKSTDTKHGSEGEVNDGQFRDSYIVGGSVFDLNFITYGGSEPVYYGIKKESCRSRQMKY